MLLGVFYPDMAALAVNAPFLDEAATQHLKIVQRSDFPVFDPKFAFEVALKYEPLHLTMERFGVEPEQMQMLMRFRPFLLAVKNFQREIAEQGITFKAKARLLSEDLLETTYLMVRDAEIPASVRMDGIKSVVRWAELDGDARREAQGTQFNIQINLGG